MKSLNVKGFTELKLLGNGTYGRVYKVKRQSDGNVYALKVVNLSNLSTHELESSLNEIRLMASFTSPFIIRFYEAFIDNKRLCIVSEYSRLGDLAHLIDRRKRKNKPLPEETVWCYFLQLLEGLHTLHSSGVIHRDLKSANILLSAPDLIKIADLGVSTALETRQLAKTQIGTPLYLAPEIWKNRPYNQKCDIWSLGVILYEMMNFSYPFLARDASDLGRKVVMGKYIMPSYTQYSPDLISVVRRLLQVNPMLRPSTEELLNMQCIKERKRMLDRFLKSETLQLGEKLLDTIKVPDNIKNINLPNPTYNVKADIIKPIDQRLHFKKGVPLYKKIDLVSSPELQLVTDCDWWTPIRPNTNLRTEKEYQVHEPTSQSSLERVQTDNVHIVNFSRLDEIPPSPQRAPRRYVPPPPMINAIRNPSHYRNSRFKRQAIR